MFPIHRHGWPNFARECSHRELRGPRRKGSLQLLPHRFKRELAKRLDHVSDRTLIQKRIARLLEGHYAHDYDCGLRRLFSHRSKGGHAIDAITLGHHHIQRDELRLEFSEEPEALRGIFSFAFDMEAKLDQVMPDDFPRERRVIYYQRWYG